MNRQMANNKSRVISSILDFIYDIKPELHQNYAYAVHRAEQTEMEKVHPVLSNGHPPAQTNEDDYEIDVSEIEEYHRPQCVAM